MPDAAPPDPTPAERQQVAAAQLRAHYEQIPAMALAPAAGGLFTAWVLWGAVDNRVLVIGMSAVIVLSALRLLLWRHYFKLPPASADHPRWRVIAVVAAGVSGCIWGGAAPFLYPPLVPDYAVFLVVLLTLLPIVPVSALASYMPALYAYYLPCIAPFVVTLAQEGTRAEKMTALLLVMMMGAMLTFARRYSKSLAEAKLLQVRLSRQSQELRDAIGHRQRFMAAASHDLRQPVQAMGLLLQTLREQGGRVDAGPLIGHIDITLRNLRGMLENMLDSGALDAEVMGAKPRDFNLEALLAKLAEEHAPLAARKGLDFRARFDPAVAFSDPLLVERILRNLLANALKYTEHGGVALVCRARGRAWRVQVFDTGVGIAAVDQPLVFNEFTRLRGPGYDGIDGLGLGLAIVQRMASLLDHPVSVRSSPGRGTAFSIDIPRGGFVAATVVPEGPAVAAPPPAWVAVLDDDPAVGAATAGLLQQWGQRVTVCRTAEEALALFGLGSEMPAVLIADFRLGAGHSGLDAARRILGQAGRHVPVIVMTGDTAPDRIREAYAAGHVLLHKPVDPQRLRLCLADALATKDHTMPVR